MTQMTKTKNQKVIGSKPKKESKALSIATQYVWVALAALLFGAFAYYMLAIKNEDYLFAVNEHSLFQPDNGFFMQMLSKPGGLMSWIGCFLTQLFYYPWLGASALVLIWLVTFAASIKAFNLSAKVAPLALLPLGALLCSETALGYWLFYIKVPGYWFSASVGYLFAVLMIWAGSKLQNYIVRSVYLVAFGIIGYIMAGWLGLAAILYLIVDYLVTDNSTNNKLIHSAVGVACLIVLPILGYNVYTAIRLDQAFYPSFPLLEADKAVNVALAMTFGLVALIPLIFPFINKYKYEDKPLTTKSGKWALALSIIVSLSVIGTASIQTNYDNANFNTELRMYQDISNAKWEEALDKLSENHNTPTRQMVLMKNIALMNNGHLGDRMFRYNNFGEPPYVKDSLKVHMAQVSAPLIYLNYGKTNFANRWIVENAVEFGYNIDMLKILVKCAIINGEYDLAKKYLKILGKTMFYKEWALDMCKYIGHPELVKKSELLGPIHELHANFKNVLDGDNGLCEMYLLNYFSNTMNKDSKKLQEVTLIYALVQKDIQLFWPRFLQYATLHSGEEMPIHYQEAAFLYGNLEPQTMDISKMPFDKEKVIDRYASFQQVSQSFLKQGMTSEQVGEAMKTSFGDTFWWFYFFCRDVKSY